LVAHGVGGDAGEERMMTGGTEDVCDG